MIDASNLTTYRDDFTGFAKDLVIPAAHGPARFGDVMAPFQAEAFEALAPSLLAVRSGKKPPVSRYWLERSKGSSKDSDLAVALVWLLVFSPRPLLIQVAAADADQASEIRLAIKDLLRLNPVLAELLTVLARSVLNKTTEAQLDVLTSDAPSAHGSRPDLLVCNELSHIAGDLGREFVENLLDNATKVPRAVVAIATNAGFVGSWQEQWRKLAESSPRWWFRAINHPAPWLSKADLQEAEQRNSPSRFARLYHGTWASGEGDALERSWITRALTLTGPMRGPEFGWRFVGGLDLGLKRDSTALVVVAKHCGGCRKVNNHGEKQPVTRLAKVLADVGCLLDTCDETGWPAPYSPSAPPRAEYEETEPTGELRLAYVQVWRPPGGKGEVDLGEVEAECVVVNKRFALAQLLADRWQAAYLIKRLQQKGVNADGQDFTGGALTMMASEVLTGFRESRIKLFDQPDLLHDLRQLRLVEKSYGVRLESPRGPHGHGDSATSFGLCLLAAKRLKRSAVPVVRRPLVWSDAEPARSLVATGHSAR